MLLTIRPLTLFIGALCAVLLTPTLAPADDSPSAQARLLSLPGSNAIEVEEMGVVVANRLIMERGFTSTAASQHSSLARAFPDRSQELFTLVRSVRNDSASGTILVQAGFLQFRSQPIHLWTYAAASPGFDSLAESALAETVSLFEGSKESLRLRNNDLHLSQLEVRPITLSYIDVDRCLALLKTFGYQVVEFGRPQASVGKLEIINPLSAGDLENLPIILPVPEGSHLDLVSGTQDARGGAIASGPGIAATLPGHTSVSPTMQILVLYHPAKPEQFSAIDNLIKRIIDVPSRQILIEAMVLEISESGFRALGIEWNLMQDARNAENIRIGSLLPNEILPTADILTNDRVFGYFQAQLQALVESGQAEVLSRPSVLTIDNRQASIRVGEEIPIAKTFAGVRATDRLSFDFQYLPVGIMLNVRPRINALGDEVSLQIDGTVSAIVLGEDLILRDPDRQELARAPRISTRRVQTYSRVANNTPFIIGGLISNNESVEQRKVPVLGELPLLGALFRSEVRSQNKREVIIVITPHVLDDDSLVTRLHPKDGEQFDNFGNRLFRDAYRLRSDDVTDLRFLQQLPQLTRLQAITDALVENNFRLSSVYPFDQFVMQRIPGEEILVYRQIYNLIARLGIDEEIELKRLIYLEPDGVGYFWETLSQASLATKPLSNEEIFSQLGGEALAFTFTIDETTGPEAFLEQPIPTVRRIPCADREEWRRLLWKLNQPAPDGRQQFTILLQSEADLDRLRRAIQVKNVVALNAGRTALRLRTFQPGAQVLMPTLQPGQVSMLDAETARYFYLSHHFYPAIREELIIHSNALLARLNEGPYSQKLQQLNIAPPLGVPHLPRTLLIDDE